ncbi:MAG: tetratricopeptide repeat protein [Gemmatimonadetes bacterium]|nr:tetratricopeptide repeat protein [Gemmatimonadota bacterium]
MGTAQGIESLEVRLVEWVKQNRRAAIIVGVVIALVAGGAWFWWTARERRETFAERALASARSSAEAGNLPLASSDLARLISTYSGTRAAQEATLLLSQVRLLQNQAALAVGDLRKFVSSGPRSEFRGPANGLLGAALEEASQPGEAAKAYEAAAAATPYRGVKAQYLVDAARTYATAGDTAKAARIYEELVRDFKDQSSAVEAKVRLSEIRPAALRQS